MPTSRRRTPSSTTSQDAPVDPDHPASSTVSAARTTGAANVRWIEDVDFWIAQAVHAGSGDRSTAGKPRKTRGGKTSGSGSSSDSTTRPAAEQADAPDDSVDLDLPGATLSEFDGVRYLHLGDTPWVQGAMRLRKPDVLELDYVQRMCVWLLWREASPGLRAAQLGLGAAALTRFCHGPLGLRTTAVEINAQVVAACRHWFKLPADGERLQVVVSDAGRWIAAPERAASLDVLNVDLYDHQAAAPVLDDAAFYAACHAALAPGGLMTVNLFGRKASFARSAERIAAAFGAPHCALVRPTAEGNTIVVAHRADAGSPGLPGVHEQDEAGRAALAERAAAIVQAHGLPANRWLTLLRPLIGPSGKPTVLKAEAASRAKTRTTAKTATPRKKASV
jgi:spermidine synthase